MMDTETLTHFKKIHQTSALSFWNARALYVLEVQTRQKFGVRWTLEDDEKSLNREEDNVWASGLVLIGAAVSHQVLDANDDSAL